jgi:hypothetical protein
MPYRPGDPTVQVEAEIEVTTAKAYLIKPTMGGKDQVWLPKSQTVSMSEPDENGLRVFEVTEWWYDKSEIAEPE